MTRVAILGSGMAGFGAAHRMRERGVTPVMFEKLPHFGGHTASYRHMGFTYDEGPHVSFTQNKRLQALLAENIENRYETLNAQVHNLWKGHWIKHPAQVNLHGLPTDLVVSIINDFVAAQQAPEKPIRNYADWLYASFGKTFAETFPMEYTIKYHTTPAENLSTDWLGPRLYRPKLEEVLRGALSPQTPNVHYVDHFRYPSSGGFQAYLERFARETDLRLSHEMRSIDPRGRRIRFASGAEAEYDRLISSVPLPELVPRIEDAPREVLEAAERLACTELVIVNVAVRRRDLLSAHWCYFYDRDVLFSRVSTPHLQSPNNAPPGCGMLQAECYFSKKYRARDKHPDDFIERVVADLRRCRILRDDDEILFKNSMLIPYANIIFDLERAPALAIVHDWLREVGIHWCGRYGDWGYLWTDEAFVSGENAAERALEGAR
jgi:protoporphyrinogen oxidase